MQIQNSTTQYGFVAKFFHWLVFILVVGLLIVGTIMHDLDNTPFKFQLYGLHKAFGITVLTLTCLRLIWKLVNTSPSMPVHMNNMQKLAARGAHWLFYVLLITMPLSGWLMSSAAGFPVSVFGLFTMPNLIAPDKELMEVFEEIHEICANGLMVLIGLHALAALTHHYYYKDNVLKSMLPFVKVDNEKNN